MILIFIILISIVQILCYLVIDSFKIRNGKNLLLTAILLGHFFLFPHYFSPEYDTDRVNCAMPILGITLGFWVLGGGLAVVTHFIYYLIRKITQVIQNKRSPL